MYKTLKRTLNYLDGLYFGGSVNLVLTFKFFFISFNFWKIVSIRFLSKRIL